MKGTVQLCLRYSTLALGAFCASSASAQSANDEVAPKPGENALHVAGRPLYISPMISFVVNDNSREAKNGIGGALTIGSMLTDTFAVEASAFYLNSKPDDYQLSGFDRTMKTYGYGASVLAFPFSGKLTNLYGLAGVHYSDHDNAPNGSTSPTSLVDYDGISYDAGVGLMLGSQMFGLPAAFRIESRYRFETLKSSDHAGSDNEKNFGDVIFNLGVVVPLFHRDPPPPADQPAPSAEVVAIPDADGDGIPDDADQCPDTPAGSPVDTSGCPAAPPAPPKPPCKLPSAANEVVDLSGCATGDVIVLNGVTFDFDTSRLTPNAKVILDQVINALKTAQQIKVEVGGHTDSKGSDEYNQRLSERRADAVTNYLVQGGIALDRLSSAGYGETKPVADNDTDEGRELNRRVELTIRE